MSLTITINRLIHEPTAAALAYGLQNKYGMDGEKHVLIFDFGGGTFDVTIMRIDGGNYTVIATDGDTHLGGANIDRKMAEFFADDIKARYRKDIRQNVKAYARLRVACEKVKRLLSSKAEAPINVTLDGIEYSNKIMRAKFDEINADIFDETLKIVQKALKVSKLGKEEIDDVVLVGGSSRILKIQSMLAEFFGSRKLSKAVNADEAVAIGAAIQAALSDGQKHPCLDEIQQLEDVTPLSLGTDVVGDRFSVIIPKNTKIPVESTRQYTTVQDNETRIRIYVYQGERVQASQNLLLGEFELLDVPPMKAGEPRIELTYKFNIDGILEVTATCKNSGTRNRITIRNNRLSKSQIQAAQNAAAQFKERDEQVIAVGLARNNLLEFCNRIRSTVSRSAMSPLKKKTINTALDDTLQWLNENQTPDMREIDEHKNHLQALLDR